MTNSSHTPGSWPPALQTMKAAREVDPPRFTDETRARFLSVLGGAREILDDQPSPRTVRAAGRRLCAAIALLADDVATQKQDGGR